MHRSVASLVAAGWISLAPAVCAQTLVENLNQAAPFVEPDGSPNNFVDFGAEVIFAANSEALGREAWLTDGTEAGTRLFADLYPGPGSGDPREWTELTPGTWLFNLNTPEYGYELWRTDGTEAGTQLVKDILPGPVSSGVSGLEQHNGEVYFFARDASSVFRGLWKSDGTEQGTVKVSDFSVGAGPTFSNGTESILSTPLGLFFSSVSNDLWRLWLTDGTPQAEVLLKEQEISISGRPRLLTLFNGQLYFQAGAEGQGIELWTSDGTPAGTDVLVEIVPGSGGSEPRAFTVLNDELFFTAFEPGLGRELWKTDGTVPGTVRVTSSNLTGPFANGTDPTNLVAAQGFLFFVGSRQAVGREVFVTNGTPGAPGLFADFEPGAESSNPFGLTVLGNQLICMATVGDLGAELYASDGTPEGTGLLKDIQAGPESGLPVSFFPLGDRLLFAADDGIVGRELWETDGTPEGTRLVKDVDPAVLDISGSPLGPVRIGSRVTYAIDDGIGGRQRWLAGPGLVGLEQAVDPAAGTSSLSFSSAFEWRGYAWVALFEPATGNELWRLDGTVGGAVQIGDLNPGPEPSNPRFLGDFNGELYFAARGPGIGEELYATDGTSAGTRLVADINSGGSGGPFGWEVLGDTALFLAVGDGLGRELWRTDGTQAGTQLVVDLAPGSSSGATNTNLASLDGRVFFTGPSGQLYTSDGTAAGTGPLDPLDPSNARAPFGFTNVDQGLVFLGQVDSNNQQLFVVTPGASVATPLTSIEAPPLGSGLTGTLLDGGGTAYIQFDALNGPNQQLLRTDGSPEGTQLVTAIDPTGAYTDWFDVTSDRTTDGRLIFGSNGGPEGQELWVTDGTEQGTFRLTDVNPAGADSRPGQIKRAGSRIYFSADDGLFGTELHSIPVTSTGGWIAEPYGEGCPGTDGIPQLGFSGEARIGSPFTLELTSAAASSLTSVYIGLTGLPSDLGGGCTALIADPTLIGILPTDAAGSLSVPFVIPAEPALIGINVWSQIVVADSLGALGGTAALTGALELVIGG